MSCTKDGNPCDPESLVCRFNPKETEPYYINESTGQKTPFKNMKCSNFKKEAKP